MTNSAENEENLETIKAGSKYTPIDMGSNKFVMKRPSTGGKAGPGVYVSRFPDYSLLYYTSTIKNDPPIDVTDEKEKKKYDGKYYSILL